MSAPATSRGRASSTRRPRAAWGVLFGLLLVVPPAPAQPQQEMTLSELDLAYRAAVDEYRAAFQALEVLESRFDRAARALDSAMAVGDESATNRAFTETQRLAPQRRLQEQRVREKAEAVRMARDQLLEALAGNLEMLLEQADTARDPDQRREIAALVLDTRNRITELRSEEDPEVVLEPEPDIVIGPRDSPEDIRIKASILEVRGSQYEEQLAEIGRRLEDLRRELGLVRRSGDFLAGLERFDDPRLPVGAPGARTVSRGVPAPVTPEADSLQAQERPLTLEERIQALVVLQEEVTERVARTKAKAERFRKAAGGLYA